MKCDWPDFNPELFDNFSTKPELLKQRKSDSSNLSPKTIKKLKRTNAARRELHENSKILYRTTSMNIPDLEMPLKHHQKVTITTFANDSSKLDCQMCTDVVHEQRRLTKLLKAVNDNLENSELKEVISLYKDELRTQWRQLAQVIDAMLLYMFTTSTFLLIFYLWNKAPQSTYT